MGKGKSAGPDNIIPELLFHLGEKAKSTLLELFRHIWDSNFPSEWRKAEIVPILKNDKEGNAPNDFRPIALTSSLSKLFERILVNRLEMFIEQKNGLTDQQAGFRRNRSAIEQVVWLSQAIKDGFQRKQSTLAVFIDFKTAFDRVWREKLLSKLLSKGVNGQLYKNISSFLAQRFIRVRYNNVLSSYRQTRQGLPQGSVLSPWLFNMMIDDVTSTLESTPGISSLLYADDLVVWGTSSDVGALEDCLNGVLRRLLEWCDSNEMLLNPDKTKFQLFTLSTKNHEIQLQFNGEELSRTKEAIYLGAKLDTKLTWNKHIHKQAEQATRRIGLLKRLTSTKWGAKSQLLASAYKAYVRPILEYGSELTITASQSASHRLEVVQNQALRIITGAPKSTPVVAMELQTSIEPVPVRKKLLALFLYERIRRLSIPHWIQYKPPTSRLKTQVNFWCQAETLIRESGTEIFNRQPFPPKSIFDTVPNTICRLEMTQSVSKECTSIIELKAVASETIAQWYPESEWLHVYTDGSARNATALAGAGVYSSLFTISAPVGKLSSNFDGEMKAIQLALQEINRREVVRVVLFIDSQAAILAISSHASTASIVLQSRSLICKILSKGTSVILQWIPSHCGLRGNEEADRLAKEGSQKAQPDNPVEFDGARRIIKAALLEKMNAELREKAKGKQWEKLGETNGRVPLDLPRAVSVACFRLTTGHDYLGKHLFRIGVVRSPLCVLCDSGAEMSGTHIVETCPALEDIRETLRHSGDCKDLCSKRATIYWAARRRMAEAANAPA